jgi:hypothetical protein
LKAAADYDDAEEAREAWEEAWGEGLARLGVLATAAALIDIRDGGRLPLEFSVNCNLGVYDDVEDVRGRIHPSSCDPLGWVDAEAREAVVDGLFERPETLAWVRRLAATEGPMTIGAVERAMRGDEAR